MDVYRNSGRYVTYSLNLNGVTVQGIGNTEAAAKEDALKKINDIVLSNNVVAPLATSSRITATTDRSGKSFSTNMIGRLQEICVKNHLSLPIYEFVSSEGMSHVPTFKISCSVIGIGSTVGVGKSKKDAKHNAAAKMLEMINAPLSSTYEHTRNRRQLPLEPERVQERVVTATVTEVEDDTSLQPMERLQLTELADNEELVCDVRALSPSPEPDQNSSSQEEENTVLSAIPLPSMEDYLCSQFNNSLHC